MAASQRGPRVELQPLGENLEDTIELALEDDLATLGHTYTTPAESAPRTSRSHSSSRSTPPCATHVMIARVNNLEAQMATLLYHIHPFM